MAGLTVATTPNRGQETPSASSPQTVATGSASASAISDEDALQLAKAEKLRLTQLAKTFGHIPGVAVGTIFRTRLHCSESAVHRHPMAGIHGSKNEGAYSIVLSAGYKDDEDRGDVIIYTGAGGRQKWSDKVPTKRLRFGRQVRDQTWDDWGNRSLVVSRITGLPVRVVRGWMSCTKYAPVQGYRYDGLYTVVSHWIEQNESNLDICRYRLERLPDQPPIPIRSIPPPQRRRRRKQRTAITTTPVFTVTSESRLNLTTGPTQINLDVSMASDGANPAMPTAGFKRSALSNLELGEERLAKKARTFAICSISGGQSVQVGVLTLRNTGSEPSSPRASNATMLNANDGDNSECGINSGKPVDCDDNDGRSDHLANGINRNNDNVPNDYNNESEGDDAGPIGDVLFGPILGHSISKPSHISSSTPMSCSSTPMPCSSTSVSCSSSPMPRSSSPMSRSSTPMPCSSTPMSCSSSPMPRSSSSMSRSSTPMPCSPTPMSRSLTPMSHNSSPRSRSPSPMLSNSTAMSRSSSPSLMIKSEPSGSPESTPSAIMMSEEHESFQELEEKQDACSTDDNSGDTPSDHEPTDDFILDPLPSLDNELDLPDEWEFEGRTSSVHDEEDCDSVLWDSEFMGYLYFSPPCSPRPSLQDFLDIIPSATNAADSFMDTRGTQVNEDRCDPLCVSAVHGASVMETEASNADLA